MLFRSKGDAYQPSSALLKGRQRIRPDLERLNDAEKLLTGANKVVIMVGRGALETGRLHGDCLLAGGGKARVVLGWSRDAGLTICTMDRQRVVSVDTIK